ncbi:hypothetical protein GCM10009706_21320 [Curtobacterium citreum]|nr:hypothetical protein GCM10009706_21320 [Curtobacterium citreum]
MRLIASSLVALALIAGATACSSSDSYVQAEMTGSTDSPTTGAPISESDYKRAFDTFRKCSQDSGVQITVTGSENEVIQYVFEQGGESKVDKCYQNDFAAADIAWQQQRLAAGTATPR